MLYLCTLRLSYGVTVALQILVLSVQVRILVAQQRMSYGVMVALQILALSVRVRVLVAQLHQMNKLVACIVFGCLLLGQYIPANAQYYKTGEDPARLKWNQLQTGPYQIIYPRGTDSLAFRYAWLLEQITPHVMSSLEAATPSIPVVLHPYNLNSNGMVVWAPKRMELITTPPSSGSMHNWEKQLAIHETRHVAQMQRAGENFFRGFRWFFGQQSEGVSVGLYFPRWLLEGDAVMTETLLSSAGRGREASFLMPYKAYFAENKSFPYDKWRYGSFRHYIPDHYALGYMKLSVATLNAAEDALSRIFTDITKYPYWPFIYGTTFKKNYGAYAVKLWDPAADYFNNIWQQDTDGKEPRDPGKQLNRSVTDYVRYASPALVVHEDGSKHLYAIKSSLAITSRLIRLDNNDSQKEKTICLTGNINGSINANGPYIYWSETVSGYRWAHENYSVILKYNAVTGRRQQLTYKTRYFNPAPDPDNRLLAVAYYKPRGGSQLHLLNAMTGELLEIFEIPDGGQITEIAWSGKNTLIVMITGENGTGIYKMECKSGRYTTILPPSFHSLGGLQYAGGKIYFKSDRYFNTDNIYSMNEDGSGILQLTRARFGVFDPLPDDTPSGTSLYYTNYTSRGYQLTHLHPDSLLNVPVCFSQKQTDPFFLAEQSAFNVDTLNVPDNISYPVKKYSKLLHAFRIHSWMPFYFNYDQLENFTFQEYYKTVAPGFTVMSQNTLGTLVSTLGYSYHKGFHAGHLQVNYSGLLPVFSFRADINDRYRTHTFSTPENGQYKWASDTLTSPGLEISLRSYIPFTFNSHGWQRGLVPQIRYSITNDTYKHPLEDKTMTNQMFQAGIQYYQMMNRAPRDIFPRFGFGLNVQASFAPGSASLFTNILYMQAYGYLPGILRNQALKWSLGWQEQQDKDRFFYLGTFMAAPRGLDDRILAPKTLSASLDYAIPVWIGDPSIPDIIYIKRFQVIPFADYMQARQRDGSKNVYWSVGTDLLMDFHLFRIGVMLSAGVRYAFTCEHKHRFEFLFSFPAFY